jgi:hypothetical protein
MVTDTKFDLSCYPLKGAVDSLNDELAALDLASHNQTDLQKQMYGEGVFGIKFNGVSRLGALVDNIARTMWPEDLAAVAPQAATQRDHLVVAANYPDEERTEALQFFTIIRPGLAPWIADEAEGSALRALAEIAVDIDSSARLQDDKITPPQYNGPPDAYLHNLYWLVVEEDYPSAVVEINREMTRSLGSWGITLDKIEGAEPRRLGTKDYTRYEINPGEETNSMIVEMVRQTPPTMFTIREGGLPVLDETKKIAA